jgi:VanZ family protein
MDAGRNVPRPAVRFLPPLVWMGLIAFGSSGLFGHDRTDSWALAMLGPLLPSVSSDTLELVHTTCRKLWHVAEYAILAVLWERALRPSPRAVSWALLATVAYAVLDELRQGLVPNREPAVLDVGIDAGGALLGLVVWTGQTRLTALTLRAAAWGLGTGAGLVLLEAGLAVAQGQPAATLSAATVGLALAAAALARLARAMAIRASSGPRPPPAP